MSTYQTVTHWRPRDTLKGQLPLSTNQTVTHWRSRDALKGQLTLVYLPDCYPLATK
ncbi:hypothetical protein DPMN_168094 [Dreissena polymorpha]|uniref:Uncharacterized protein n=1 Tax=Dreissena polymorpha TaxID=45954 RepID=A0A9D4IYZ4_DREPO|nr:hypothetical protein DPMN_168094 [Dreissena polymorpha]